MNHDLSTRLCEITDKIGVIVQMYILVMKCRENTDCCWSVR